MRVGILGTGEVGRTLGSAFLELGYETKLGGREASNEAAATWVSQAGNRASAGTFADAAAFGDLLVLATLGVANESAVRAAGLGRFDDKLLVDATNPLDFTKGAPALAVGHLDSAGEQLQRLLPRARVVKAFNTVGHALMFRPKLQGGPPDMFICGNDTGAKSNVRELLTAFGWGTIDLGGIEASRYLEPMCMVWVQCGFTSGTWNHAFKLLRQ